MTHGHENYTNTFSVNRIIVYLLFIIPQKGFGVIRKREYQNTIITLHTFFVCELKHFFKNHEMVSENKKLNRQNVEKKNNYSIKWLVLNVVENIYI